MNNNNIKESSKKNFFQDRSKKMQQIDDLYREEIKKIYTESKSKLQNPGVETKIITIDDKKSSVFGKQGLNSHHITKQLQSPKSVSTYNVPQSQSSSSKMLNSGSQIDEKVRASVFLKGQSTKTIEILRRENESKELKIRQLSNKCQNLVQKLKQHLSDAQFQTQIESLRQFSDGKMERLQQLFKIKQEEIFFKMKLQVIGLLQQFGIMKEELAQFNEVSSESNLYNLMTKKLKGRLKEFRSKEQESSFELQKDKIMSQKQQERIHFLTETNELLKLSETKLKTKIEELKGQLNDYLQKFKMRERQNEQNQSEVFRLKKQNEELQVVNHKLNAANKNALNERQDERRLWQAKQKEMKVLLNNYFIEKKQLEDTLESKDGQIEQLFIKYRFMEQQNERISRELVRWKERYEILEKQRNFKARQIEEEKNLLMESFEKYKANYNEGVLINQKNQAEEAIRKIQEYQRAYQRVVLQLEEQRSLLQRAEEEARKRFQFEQRQWLQRFKGLQKIKEDQLFEINQDCQSRLSQMRVSYQKREELLAEQMQARMKNILAQKDKKATQLMIQLQRQNDELRQEIVNLNKVLEVKQSLINVINSKKG